MLLTATARSPGPPRTIGAPRGRRARIAVAALAAGCAMLAVACGGGGSATPTASPRPAGTRTPVSTNIPANVGKDDHGQLTGAGATFPNALYTRWFFDYHDHVAPGVKINYQAIGSGGGIQQITQRIIDFGATDAPMTDAEMAKAPGIQHIPTVLGAVVVTYNIAGVSTPLRLDGGTIAKIYLGEITKWDDAAIAAHNPGVALPDADIVVVHRSDGSGTSYVFTDYLSHVSSEWSAQVGTSKNPQWPKGLGGQGNDGVTQQVKQNQNSIGYVELIYADQNQLPKALIRDQAGEYIAPSTQATSLAAEGLTLPPDYRVSIVNSPAPGAYPIASFTYILLYKDQSNENDGRVLVNFLWWAIHDGQHTAAELDYAPLPASVVRQVEQTLLTEITHDGEPLLQAP